MWVERFSGQGQHLFPAYMFLILTLILYVIIAMSTSTRWQENLVECCRTGDNIRFNSLLNNYADPAQRSIPFDVVKLAVQGGHAGIVLGLVEYFWETKPLRVAHLAHSIGKSKIVVAMAGQSRPRIGRVEDFSYAGVPAELLKSLYEWLELLPLEIIKPLWTDIMQLEHPFPKVVSRIFSAQDPQEEAFAALFDWDLSMFPLRSARRLAQLGVGQDAEFAKVLASIECTVYQALHGRIKRMQRQCLMIELFRQQNYPTELLHYF